MSDFLKRICLRRLELYVVDVIKWGNPIGESIDSSLPLTSRENKGELLKLIGKLTDSKEVENFEVGEDVVKIVSAGQEMGAKAVLANFERLAAQGGNPELEKEARRIRREMETAIQAREEAEEAERIEREKAKIAEDEAQKAYSKAASAEESAIAATVKAEEAESREKQVVTQNIFLRSVLSHDLDHLLKLHHTIGQDALTIERFVRNLLESARGDAPIQPEKIRIPLERISFRCARILSITRFATRANHVAASEEYTGDLIEYIREYISNILDGHVTALTLDERRIPIQFLNPENFTFQTTFSPLNVSVVLDNLFSNSRKHGCTEIKIEIAEMDENSLSLTYRDNGKGIPKKNEAQLFKPGFSTTDGSGLGLCHMKEIMEDLGGNIIYRRPETTGAEFILIFPRNEN